MKKRTKVIKVAITITTGAWITSKGKTKEKNQGITRKMIKGKEAESKKIVHSWTIDPLLASSM